MVVDSVREERRIQGYQTLPDKLVLIAVFTIFVLLVLALPLIPLFSPVQRQSRTIWISQETALSLAAADRHQKRPAPPKNRFCSLAVVVPDLGDHDVIQRNSSEDPRILSRVGNKVNPDPLKAESCSRI